MPQSPVSAEPTLAPSAPATPQPPADVAREVAALELLQTSGAPANAAQLRGLRVRRDELREQLERANEERSRIQGRLREESDAGTQQLLGKQLEATSARVLSLDEAIATTEKQIAAAPPELLAETHTAAPAPDYSGWVRQDEAAGMAFSTFGLGALLTLLVGRWRRRRRPAPAPRPEPQLQQLAVAVDAIALEVERIGEGQRFVTQLLAERDAAAPARAVRAAGSEITLDAPGPRAPSAGRVATPH